MSDYLIFGFIFDRSRSKCREHSFQLLNNCLRQAPTSGTTTPAFPSSCRRCKWNATHFCLREFWNRPHLRLSTSIELMFCPSVSYHGGVLSTQKLWVNDRCVCSCSSHLYVLASTKSLVKAVVEALVTSGCLTRTVTSTTCWRSSPLWFLMRRWVFLLDFEVFDGVFKASTIDVEALKELAS